MTGCSVKNVPGHEFQNKTIINYIADGDQEIEIFKGNNYIRNSGIIYRLDGINSEIKNEYRIIIWAKGSGYPEFYQICNGDEFICSGYIVLDKSYDTPDNKISLKGKVAVLGAENKSFKTTSSPKPLFTFAYDILNGKFELQIRE